MPELPEIETIKRGLSPHVQGLHIKKAILRFPTLRWPIPQNLDELVRNQKIEEISRRGKYLLFQLNTGVLIIHLGMSGSLCLVKEEKQLRPHDHVDFVLSSGQILRYHDPRRFGAILWTKESSQHPLLSHLGIEPLHEEFTAAHLKELLGRHRLPIKLFLMNSKFIVGIGNIYAAEALFLAKIHPAKAANQLSNAESEALVHAIKTVLQAAIDSGGTTLKDFVNGEGKPGYFSQKLYVYGQAGKACQLCAQPLESMQLGQRSSVFCPNCQPICF